MVLVAYLGEHREVTFRIINAPPFSTISYIYLFQVKYPTMELMVGAVAIQLFLFLYMACYLPIIVP